MERVDLCFYDNRPGGERIDVGSGVHIVLWENGDIGFEHICPGIWQDPGDNQREFLVAPLWGGEIIAKNSLTLRPSLLCLGAGKPCGLHGFVTNGVWKSI